MLTDKNWYFAVYSGLIEAKHIKTFNPERINALWLYFYLLKYANRENGTQFKKAKTIAREMGLSERTVRRNLLWLKKNIISNSKGCLEDMKLKFVSLNQPVENSNYRAKVIGHLTVLCEWTP